MLASIITDSAVTIFDGGKVHTLGSDQPSFSKVVEALRTKDDELALKLIDPSRIVIDGTAEYPEFKVKDGVVTYQDQPLEGYAVEKILELVGLGFPIDALVEFLLRLQTNPSSRAVTELYEFLEKGQLPLLPDGRFIAYKRIKDDWSDCHTGKISNAVGTVVEMQRNQVDDDSTRTCSHGLHVCSMGYLSHFSGARVVAVAVAPEDVVSIPKDYDAQKMRCCRYEVLAEIQEPTVHNPWGVPVLENLQYVFDLEEDDEEEYGENEETDAA